jgi:formiminoglutamase
VQLELAQRTYMDEFAPFAYREASAEKTQTVLKPLLQTMLGWGQEHYAR